MIGSDWIASIILSSFCYNNNAQATTTVPHLTCNTEKIITKGCYGVWAMHVNRNLGPWFWQNVWTNCHVSDIHVTVRIGDVWHKAYPICDAPLLRLTWHSYAPSQKLCRKCHHSCVRTEALSGTIFVVAQKLSSVPWTPPKARFRHRTFHEPNLIRIKADPNYLLDRLNWFRRRS